jgi:hypothetical protein
MDETPYALTRLIASTPFDAPGASGLVRQIGPITRGGIS